MRRRLAVLAVVAVSGLAAAVQAAPAAAGDPIVCVSHGELIACACSTGPCPVTLPHVCVKSDLNQDGQISDDETVCARPSVG